MSSLPRSDAYVVGAGPNGLSAAIVLALAGVSVTVIERSDTIGGGARTAELTLPGFHHDICSAVHPLAVASPFLGSLPLHDYGLQWIHPAAPLAHSFDNGSAIVLDRSLDSTAHSLKDDATPYHKLLQPLLHNWNSLTRDLLGPLRFPRDMLSFSAFGLNAVQSAKRLAESTFSTQEARALFAGMAAHSMIPLEKMATSAFGLILAASAHVIGWPFPRGGAQKISDALAAHLRSLGGAIVTGHEIRSLDDLPPSRAVLCDVTPRQLLHLAGDRLPHLYRQALKAYRYGPGAFKVDYALSAPIPWKAVECSQAGTVHLGGTLAEIAAAESAVWHGRTPDRPFVLLAQPTLFDPTRAPAGRHIAWVYCHVPNSSTFDMLSRIEDQIERFAPGFRDVVLARSIMKPADLERHNPNLIGGDVNGGVADIFQLFMRPTARLYATPVSGLYLCSASTPPGGGVHGMCGYRAARLVLRQVFGRSSALFS